MRESYIFATMEKHRGRLVQLADKCPADKRNTVPDGFKNSIHWQLGHILTIMDIQVYGFAGVGLKLDDAYKTQDNYMGAETIDELLMGAFGHEKDHYGHINAMLKLFV